MTQADKSTATNKMSSAPGDLTPDQMLTAISELLVSTRRYQSRTDRAFANELAARIIAAMPMETKVRAAEITSKMSEPPEQLVRQLAFSSMEAAKIILSSRHITDAILMEAASKSVEFREIIAHRRSLSEPVVNRLLFHEEREIENIILPRQELMISDNRARRLIDRVTPGSTLGWLMAKRTDLSPRHSLRLFWKVEPDNRILILQRFNVDASFAAKVFAKVLKDGDTVPQGPLARLARLVAQADVDEADTRTHSRTIKTNLFDALRGLRSGSDMTATAAAADEASISVALARQISTDVAGDPFAILCRALNVQNKQFKKLASTKPMRQRGQEDFSENDRQRMMHVFEQLTPAGAAAILTYWDIDLQDEHDRSQRERLEADIANIQKRLTESMSDGGAEGERDPGDEKETGRDKENGGRRSFG